MNVLEPLRIQSEPSRTADVLRFARSEPADGSVMPIAATATGGHARQPLLLLLLLSDARSTTYGVTISKWMPKLDASAMLTAASSSVATR